MNNYFEFVFNQWLERESSWQINFLEHPEYFNKFVNYLITYSS